MTSSNWPAMVRGKATAAVAWLNKLRAASISSHIKDVQFSGGTGKLVPSPDGTTLLLRTTPQAAVGPKDFQVVSDGGDWYNCNIWDGLTAGTQIVKVAKHQDIRCILPTANPAGGAWPSKNIRGITYTYIYNAVAGATTDGVNVVEYNRSVSGDDGSTGTSEITPCLNVGDIITADPATFKGPATLVGIVWKAQAGGRAWADEPIL